MEQYNEFVKLAKEDKPFELFQKISKLSDRELSKLYERMLGTAIPKDEGKTKSISMLMDRFERFKS